MEPGICGFSGITSKQYDLDTFALRIDNGSGLGIRIVIDPNQKGRCKTCSIRCCSKLLHGMEVIKMGVCQGLAFMNFRCWILPFKF